MSRLVTNSPQSLYYHDEKKPYYDHNIQRHQTELPPTPSSSALSFLVSDQTEHDELIDDEKRHQRLPSNNGLDTASRQPVFASYGSFSSSDFPVDQNLPASSSSTISPNDDDEGLYLLWTHQLLRERGYEPSSCKLDEDEEDNYSNDSSVTDFSIMIKQANPTSNNVHLDRRKKASSFVPSWLSSCFPLC